MFRQGDVVIKRRKTLPKNVKKIEAPKLAGETGNLHVLHDAEWYGHNDTIIAVLQKESKLEHLEHGSLDLNKGIYEIYHLRDYQAEQPSQLAKKRFRDVYD